MCFRVDNPGSARVVDRVRGLQSGDKLIGIDYRPADGKLYALAADGTLYTVNDRNARATRVTDLDPKPTGPAVGFDVNPAADALRVIGANGRRRRERRDRGGLHQQRHRCRHRNHPVRHRRRHGPVSVQAPANAGTLSPTGKLGVATSTAVGLDIYSTLRNGQATSNRAFASLSVNGRTGFYAIDLLTGDARRLGSFGNRTVIGIALPLNQR